MQHKVRTSVDKLVQSTNDLCLVDAIGLSLLKLANEILKLFGKEFKTECSLLSVLRVESV